MILGKNLILALNGTTLAAAKSCSIQQSQSFINVASPTSGRWKKVVPEKLDWSVSADCLIGNMEAFNTLDQAQREGTALTLQVYDLSFGMNKRGTAYIQNLTLDGSVGNLAKMSVQLKGSDALSVYTGTQIDLTSVFTTNGYYYSEERLSVYEAISSLQAKIVGSTMTLTKRTMIRFAPQDATIFISDDPILHTAAQNLNDLRLRHEYDNVFTTEHNVWMDAGTYYILYSFGGLVLNQPKIYALN